MESNCIPMEVYIPKYEDKVAQGKIVTFFYLEVRMGNENWLLEKRYS